MNKQDKDELLNQGLTQKEIEDLTQKGFSKEEIIQSHQYDNEIKKGSTFIAWIVDLITWFLPWNSSDYQITAVLYFAFYLNTYFDLPNP